MPYKNGSPIGWLKDGVNVATGTQYYIVHTSTTKDDMQGNVNYDIANDNHPMIYLVNANKLPNWHTSDTVNHYVEGYGYGYYSDGLYTDYYADAISASDKRATAGPFETDYITMFAAVQASNGGGDYIV